MPGTFTFHKGIFTLTPVWLGSLYTASHYHLGFRSQMNNGTRPIHEYCFSMFLRLLKVLLFLVSSFSPVSLKLSFIQKHPQQAYPRRTDNLHYCLSPMFWFCPVFIGYAFMSLGVEWHMPWGTRGSSLVRTACTPKFNRLLLAIIHSMWS